MVGKPPQERNKERNKGRDGNGFQNDIRMLKVERLTRPGLEPADLELADGESVALTGPSGAGKSLFLRAIADLDPNTGVLTLDGENRDHMAAPLWRRRVIYVAAESGWWADTVSDHFSDQTAAGTLLEELGLDPDALGWPVSRLSTGEKQRLALARALILSPRVLCLDEPTSGLDPDAAAKVERRLGRYLAAGASVLFVTHDTAQAARMAGRRLIMEKGVMSEIHP